MPSIGIGIGLGCVAPGAFWHPGLLGAKLIAWYDAGTADASPINTLSSRQGSLSLTAASTNRPTVSSNGILYDGSDDQMVGASAADWKFLHDGTGCTVAVVCKVATNTNQCVWATENVTNNTGANLLLLANGGSSMLVNYRINNGTTFLINAAPAATVADSNPHLFVCSYEESASPKEITLRLDRSEIANGDSLAAPASGNPQAALTLGGQVGAPTTFPMTGRIYGLIATTALTATELSNLENYLRNKWSTP